MAVLGEERGDLALRDGREPSLPVAADQLGHRQLTERLRLDAGGQTPQREVHPRGRIVRQAAQDVAHLVDRHPGQLGGQREHAVAGDRDRHDRDDQRERAGEHAFGVVQPLGRGRGAGHPESPVEVRAQLDGEGE
ncbi:hypothetical protein ACFQYP_06125 [Nonomuraea antimicrobica]